MFNGPSESVLRRCLDLFATALAALAMLDMVHLATIKRFSEKFITLALQIPSDSTLRPSTLHETVQADVSFPLLELD